MTLDALGLPLARCPLCHTFAALPAQALGGRILATVAAYEAWAASRTKGEGFV